MRVSAAAEKAVRSGHPWVFADSVRDLNRDGQTGELAIIYDRNDRFLAAGLFDPNSPIRVRILQTGTPKTIDDAWFAERFSEAMDRRNEMFDADTNGYRLINGESDGWPGLVLDRYDSVFVLKIYSAIWFSRIEQLSGLIVGQFNPDRLVLRLSRNIGRQATPLHDGSILIQKRTDQPADGPALFLETGLRFEADVVRGQKTGFFLDQRENRRFVEQLAKGRTMLNAFSFSGGFSLYAARGGARSVVDLDISEHALESARRNFSLNRNVPAIAACKHELARGDAFEWLEKNSKRKFGLIVLDPPSFAKRESDREAGIRAYSRLAELAVHRLEPDGIMVAASCSAHVNAAEFFNAIRRVAAQSGRRTEEIRTTTHAPDHPATFNEAQYLKAIYLKFRR